MRSSALAIMFGSAMMIAAPALTNQAAAQPAPASSSSFVPVVVGAAAGATVAALLWPVIMPAGAAMAAGPGAMAMAPEAAGWMGSFVTTRAAVGAIIGGGLGYLSAR